jgi:hypothetical protein
MNQFQIELTRRPPIRDVILEVSSSGIAAAILGMVTMPAIPPTIAATFAKDSLRETSTFALELMPANALAEGASASTARVVRQSFMLFSIPVDKCNYEDVSDVLCWLV